MNTNQSYYLNLLRHVKTQEGIIASELELHLGHKLRQILTPYQPCCLISGRIEESEDVSLQSSQEFNLVYRIKHKTESSYRDEESGGWSAGH